MPERDGKLFCVPTLRRSVVSKKMIGSVSYEYAITGVAITDLLYDKICHVVKVGWESLDFHEFSWKSTGGLGVGVFPLQIDSPFNLFEIARWLYHSGVKG